MVCAEMEHHPSHTPRGLFFKLTHNMLQVFLQRGKVLLGHPDKKVFLSQRLEFPEYRVPQKYMTFPGSPGSPGSPGFQA